MSSLASLASFAPTCSSCSSLPAGLPVWSFAIEIEGRGQGDKRECEGVVGVALNHFRTALSPPRKPKHDGGSSPAAYDILPGILGNKQASVKAAVPCLGWSASADVRRFSLLSKSVPAPRSLSMS